MSRVTLTAACPEADRDDASHLAVCLGWQEGWQPDEWEMAFSAQYQDGQGNLFRVMSCRVGVSFVAAASVMGPVGRPAEDVEPYRVNLTAARRAQDKLVMWQPTDPLQPVPTAATDRIVAVVGMSGVDALAAMGLLPLASEP